MSKHVTPDRWSCRPENAAGPYGPAYDKQRDGPRLNRQHERIRDWMLSRNEWKTLAEIRQALDYPESSISAQLRHLRKKEFGSHQVWKRRRRGKGTWEYRIMPAEKQGTLSLCGSFPSEKTGARAPLRCGNQEADKPSNGE